jgi:hypothetical protein
MQGRVGGMTAVGHVRIAIPAGLNTRPERMRRGQENDNRQGPASAGGEA